MFQLCDKSVAATSSVSLPGRFMLYAGRIELEQINDGKQTLSSTGLGQVVKCLAPFKIAWSVHWFSPFNRVCT